MVQKQDRTQRDSQEMSESSRKTNKYEETIIFFSSSSIEQKPDSLSSSAQRDQIVGPYNQSQASDESQKRWWSVQTLPETKHQKRSRKRETVSETESSTETQGSHMGHACLAGQLSWCL